MKKVGCTLVSSQWGFMEKIEHEWLKWRCRHVLTCGIFWLVSVGCNPRDVLLGRGDSDAGTLDSSRPDRTSSTDGLETSSAPSTSAGTSRRSSAPSASSSAGSDSTTAGSGAAAGLSSAADVCDEAYTTCMTEGLGMVCQTLLIDCRISLPDGGPPCDEVFSRCVDFGYPEPECERAATVCEEGGEHSLGPQVDSTLSVNEANAE